MHCCDVTQHELALRLNLDLLSTFTECPLEGTARLRVSKIDYQMSFRDQLLRVGRVAVFLQVAGRGYGKNSRVQQRVISMDVLTVSEPPEEATRLRLPHAAFDVESEGLS